MTGGAQMNGFVSLVRHKLVDVGVPESAIYSRQRVELPGWFRAEKNWDLLVIMNNQLIATVEFKSQIGPSFGNNFNNRTEEALGSATDLWAAYREGAFKPSVRPWLGYLMLLEDTAASSRPVRTLGSHFSVFPEFREASYAKRYEVLLLKLLRERLYDGCAFLTSDRILGRKGEYREPQSELGFKPFIDSLLSRVRTALAAGH